MAETALVIAAHPDDGEFGAAGYSAQLAAKGWDVFFLICTNGAKGTEDRAMPRERLIALRREEQREACRRIGAKDVYFLDNEDGELSYNRALLEQVVRHIRKLRPHTVLTHDPTDIIIRDSFINHPDHRATGTAALDAGDGLPQRLAARRPASSPSKSTTKFSVSRFKSCACRSVIAVPRGATTFLIPS